MSEIVKNSTGYQSSNLFLGTVVSCNPATMVIEVAPHGSRGLNKVQGIPLSSTFASVLGFKETILPPVGSRVLCQGFGHQAIIYGVVPMSEKQGDTDANMPFKTCLSAEEPVHSDVHSLGYLHDITKLNVINNGIPTDVVQGEKVISNEFGVLLGLFQLMATLRASDLAQVQVHFLDDLVRIISHNFQHYTALGELSVSHDGAAINLECGATHDPYESLGISLKDSTKDTITTEDSGKAPGSSPDKTDNQFYQLTKNARALERLKLFVGKLGGFINLMLVNPSGDLRLNSKDNTPNTGAKPDAGLLQLKANLDGSLIVRSANGIYLEKTNWIRVPQRKRQPEDPNGDDGTTTGYKVTKAFQFDDSYVFRDTAFLYYLQLKDYLAYTNEELGYTDFKTLGKDFDVNDDYTKNTTPVGSTYIDSYTGASYKRTRSVVALMPNGGIALADNWGSCIAMEGGNIYIQPANDLVLQPNRNVVAKVGGNVSIAARKEIDLSSSEGGFRLKTQTAQHLYSDKSGILLHANGNQFTDGVQTYSKDYKTVVNVAGIVLHAPNSAITGDAQQVYFDATQTMMLSGHINTVYSDSLLQLKSKQVITTAANVVESLANTRLILYSGDTALLTGLNNTEVGTVSQTYGLASAGAFSVPVKGVLDPNKGQKAFFDNMKKQAQDNKDFKPSSLLGAFKDSTKFKSIEFQYLPTEAYGLDIFDALPQTMAQQQASVGLSSATNWVEHPVNNSYPYPGAGLQDNSYVTKALANVQKLNRDMVNKTAGLYNSAPAANTSNLFKEYKLLI